MKKAIFGIAILLVIGVVIQLTGVTKILPFYSQLTQDRVGTHVDLQPKDQKKAHYVGSDKCVKCHKEEHSLWKHSMHAKMIQDVKKDPKAIVADFLSLPSDADFNKSEIIYTIGGKFKQRFMLRDMNKTKEDYIIGNYQWNVQTKKWQGYASYKDWYKSAFVHDNKKVNTSKTCDGCHFVGFMSREIRTEPAISCESCHGPASEHVQHPKKSKVYVATQSDPIRSQEVCLQCHMRNYDKRLEDQNLSSLFGVVKDYPYGYEPGRALIDYKMPITLDDKKFYGNGVGKKNRMQGNEYVQSSMYKHGITCMNCHNPHKLDNTTTYKVGDKTCMKCHSFGSPIGPHQRDITAHTHHKEGSKGSSCIACHMPKTGRHTGKSPLTVRSHTFRFITPAQTRKYSVPNACNACHKEKSLDWAEDAMKKWGMQSWDKR